MVITHICNNYVGSKVHSNLCLALSKQLSIEQQVFIPIKSITLSNVNSSNSERVKEDYILSNKSYLKYFPLLKVLVNLIFFLKKSYKSDYIIAHTVWSDGLLAYFNYLIYKTPYTVSVRSTDFNTFFPKLRHYHWLINKIVKNANNVIFINKIYHDVAVDKYKKIFKNSDNLVVIPNGVDDFWLQNDGQLNASKKSFDYIFVGKNEPRKNFLNTYKALEKISKVRKIKFCVVGIVKDEVMKIIKCDEIPEWVVCEGIVDKLKLRELYCKSKILFLPSYRETFGLVYIEALSQGCAVIHSKGQGIDGMVNSRMVMRTEPHDVDQMSHDAEMLLDYYENNSDFPDVSSFKWDIIGKNYLDCFRVSISQKNSL